MLGSVRLTGDNKQQKRALSCGPRGNCSKCVCVYVLTQCLREKFNGKSYMYKNTYVNTIVDKYTCADVAAEPALDVFFCAFVKHIMIMH